MKKCASPYDGFWQIFSWSSCLPLNLTIWHNTCHETSSTSTFFNEHGFAETAFQDPRNSERTSLSEPATLVAHVRLSLSLYFYLSFIPFYLAFTCGTWGPHKTMGHLAAFRVYNVLTMNITCTIKQPLWSFMCHLFL